MSLEDGNAIRVCEHCGEKRPTDQFTEFQNEGLYCVNCLLKKNCSNCEKYIITLDDSSLPKDIHCEECTAGLESDINISPLASYWPRIKHSLKRGGVLIIGLIAYIGIRVIDELVVLFLRTLDESVLFLREISASFFGLRPVLAPGIAFHQDWLATDLALLLLVGGFALIFIDSLYFGPLKSFDVLTFPGTVIHEWAHKTTCQKYGLEVIDVTYFQFNRQKGYVEYRGRRTFPQIIGVSTAPLFFNSLVAISVAAVGTTFGNQIGQWGLLFAYWLAFSVGTGALPSHTDIDNIWAPILNGWRQNPRMLLAVPLVVLLRLMQILRVAYLEAIYGVLMVLVGIALGGLII